MKYLNSKTLSLFIPSIVSKLIRRIITINRNRVFNQPTGEKDAGWYDKSFHAKGHWKEKYYKSPHYFIWTVIIDRIIHFGNQKPKILELGCGSGQLACYLKDSGIIEYTGIDFSKSRVEHAQLLCDSFNFVNGDFFMLDFDVFKYDTVICLETLEHIDEDIELIKKVKSGVKFIGSVPDFPFVSHVRHFNNNKEVFQRYGDLFNNFSVHRFLDPNNRQNFLISGIRK